MNLNIALLSFAKTGNSIRTAPKTQNKQVPHDPRVNNTKANSPASRLSSRSYEFEPVDPKILLQGEIRKLSKLQEMSEKLVLPALLAVSESVNSLVILIPLFSEYSCNSFICVGIEKPSFSCSFVDTRAYSTAFFIFILPQVILLV